MGGCLPQWFCGDQLKALLWTHMPAGVRILQPNRIDVWGGV